MGDSNNGSVVEKIPFIPNIQTYSGLYAQPMKSHTPNITQSIKTPRAHKRKRRRTNKPKKAKKKKSANKRKGPKGGKKPRKRAPRKKKAAPAGQNLFNL